MQAALVRDRERSVGEIAERLADERVADVIELGRALLRDNVDHVAACGRIDEGRGRDG